MKNKIFIVLITLTFGVIIGYFGNNLRSKFKKENQTLFQIRSKGYKYINPLLDCDNFKPSSLRSLIKVKENVEKAIEEELSKPNINEISFYLRLLNDGPWIGINENENYTPASLLKVPIMIACFKKAESDPKFLKQKIEYKIAKSSYIQTILDTNILDPGVFYPVETLIEKMIVYSDNSSLELLADLVGDDLFYQVMNENGVSLKNRDVSTDYISVKDYSAFLRILFNATYLNKFYSEKSLRILSKSYYPNGIPRHLPKNIQIAHKFGEVGTIDSNLKQLHDCGIVYHKNPYLICIMSKGDDFKSLSDIIAKLSGIVYENLK